MIVIIRNKNDPDEKLKQLKPEEVQNILKP